jgi:hypothetical protein
MVAVASNLVLPYSGSSMVTIPFIGDTGVEPIVMNYTLKGGYLGCSLVTQAGDYLFKKILKDYDMNNIINRLSLLLMVFLCTIHTHLGLKGIFNYFTKGLLEKVILVNILKDSNYKNVLDRINLSSNSKKQWGTNIFNSIKECALKQDLEGIEKLGMEVVGVAKHFILKDECVKEGSCPYRLEIFKHVSETIQDIQGTKDRIIDLMKKNKWNNTLDMTTYLIKHITKSDEPHIYDSLLRIEHNINNNTTSNALTIPSNHPTPNDEWEGTPVEPPKPQSWIPGVYSLFVDEEEANREQYNITKMVMELVEAGYGPAVENIEITREQEYTLQQNTWSFYLVVLMFYVIDKLTKKRSRVPLLLIEEKHKYLD